MSSSSSISSPICSTGPEIIVNGWVRLEDDKGTQPADNIAPHMGQIQYALRCPTIDMAEKVFAILGPSTSGESLAVKAIGRSSLQIEVDGTSGGTMRVRSFSSSSIRRSSRTRSSVAST